MTMMVYSCLITIALMYNCSVAMADETTHRQAAEELLIVIDTKQTMQLIMEQLLDLQIQRDPQIASYRGVLQKFLTKYLGWESVKEELITIYVQEFTEDELKQLTAFYQTPAGKKSIEKMPQLTAKAGQLSIARVQANKAELLRMVEEEEANRKRKPQ